MEQNIRISKNQIRKAKKKAAQELRQKEKQELESSSSSRGKITIGTVDSSNQKAQVQEDLQEKIKAMEAQIKNYEETIFNQNLQIRELSNFIEDQNNEHTILKNQLIENNLITKEQL